MTNERGHGGTRPGSGPKPKPSEQRRVYKTLRLDPSTIDMIQLHQTESGLPTFTAALESLVVLGHLANVPAKILEAIREEKL